MRNHPNAALQAEWNEFGAEGFAFEISDEITPKDGRDYREESAFLEDLRLEKSQPYSALGHNEREKGERKR